MSSRLENQKIIIKHLFLNGMTKAIDIHKATNIPLSTIYYNLNKLKTLNSLERKPYPKRLKKITPLVRPAITHFAKRNPYCTSKDIQAYLEVNMRSFFQQQLFNGPSKKWVMVIYSQNLLPC